MKRAVLKNICWGNWLFFIIVTFLFIVSLLSACGTKGVLVVPDKESKPESVKSLRHHEPTNN